MVATLPYNKDNAVENKIIGLARIPDSTEIDVRHKT